MFWRRNWRPVPYIPQADEADCGAACLAMVLCAHGRSTSITDVTESCPAGRDGVNAVRLVAAARRFGLEGKTYRTAGANLDAIQLPVIAHWGLTHWVVVERWSPRWIYIVDPGSGHRKISHQEFSQSFTGIFLSFTTTVEFVRQKGRRASPFIKFFLSRMRDVYGWRAICMVIGTSVAAQLLSLLLPVLTKIIVDRVVPASQIDMMPLLGIAATLLILSQILMMFFRSLVLMKARTYMDAGSMTDLVKQLLRAPLEFFQVHSTGDLVARINSYTNVRQVLTDWSITTALDGSLLFVYLLATALISRPLALVAAGFVFLQAMVVILTHHRQRDIAYQVSVSSSEQSAFLMEIVLGAHQLKAAGAEMVASDRWSNRLLRQLNAENRQSYMTAVLTFVFGLCNYGGPVAVLWLGTLQVLRHEITAGSMLMASGLAAALFMPLARFVSAMQQLQAVSAAIYRLDNIVSAPQEKFWTTPNRRRISLEGRIDVRNVGYRYPGSSEWAVRSLSFSIPAKFKTAIVGGTGSGKSTVLNLLIGLAVPDEGEILFDGIPIEEVDLAHLRTQIGVVLQDITLFRGTIRENLTLGTPNVSNDQILQAAKLARIHGEIAALPMAYETMLSDNGANFSGGQRQRIALARALLLNPKLLILDEATSHLDVQIEQEIDATISSLRCTRIVVAHRLSTIANADQILVLDHGQLVEKGTHHRLLQQQGIYGRLMASYLNSETSCAPTYETPRA
jgi:ATP-binding cassette subfamily B protein